jgi:hypothetical protein
MPKNEGATILKVLKVLKEHSTMLREIRGRIANMELVLPPVREVSSIREDLNRLKADHVDLALRVGVLEQTAQ